MAHKTLSRALLATGLAVCMTSAAFSAEKPKLMTGASDNMLAATCVGCHGTNGNSHGPAIPTIAGLSQEYFEETLEGYASGEISSTIMGRIAKGYSKDEIKQLANYYGAKSFVKAKQTFDPKLAKKGAKLHDKYCEKCHGDGGQSAEDDAGVMAGQWTPYVQWQLADFKAGDREAPKKMNKKLKKLLSKKGEAGIEALLNFYASQQK